VNPTPPRNPSLLRSAGIVSAAIAVSRITGLIRESWNVKKRGTYFVWLLLGVDSDERPLDPIEALRQMGLEREKS